MINVRLSEEEYLELERFCIASGARSISDLVRSTMHSVVTGGDQNNSLALSVKKYSALVRNLELTVKELAAELASIRAGVKPHGADKPDVKVETAAMQLPIDAEISSGAEKSEASDVQDGLIAWQRE